MLIDYISVNVKGLVEQCLDRRNEGFFLYAIKHSNV